jgi:hypothetical protein
MRSQGGLDAVIGRLDVLRLRLFGGWSGAGLSGGEVALLGGRSVRISGSRWFERVGMCSRVVRVVRSWEG